MHAYEWTAVSTAANSIDFLFIENEICFSFLSAFLAHYLRVSDEEERKCDYRLHVTLWNCICIKVSVTQIIRNYDVKSLAKFCFDVNFSHFGHQWNRHDRNSVLLELTVDLRRVWFAGHRKGDQRSTEYFHAYSGSDAINSIAKNWNYYLQNSLVIEDDRIVAFLPK